MKTYDQIEKEIRKIEMDPRSVIGGSKEFFSGRPTYLTPAAKKKIDRLEKEQSKIEVDC